MSRYEQIVFLDEQSVNADSAEEAFDILENEGVEAAMDFLKQWHYPGEHDTRTDPGFGLSDEVAEQDGYIMAWNDGLGYISLEYDTEFDE